ncbi:hypothetical protein AB5J62_03345 [Amycolatopsis sp. cg5]
MSWNSGPMLQSPDVTVFAEPGGFPLSPEPEQDIPEPPAQEVDR